MRDQFIPEERVLAIQEALCGFIVLQVIDNEGEFYYDGVSNIDNRSKYDNIEYNFCCTLYELSVCDIYIYIYIYIH